MNSACIDLIYLDPPFNKKKTFTAPIGTSAEGAEFHDIFREEDIKDEWVDSIRFENHTLYSYLNGVKKFSNLYNYCYLVYMSIRLIECRRVLKETGSLYLHCDPTVSHYLKIMLDCIFGEQRFRNEIIWCYHGPGSPKMRQFNRKADHIFWYSKGQKWAFNGDSVRVPYKDSQQSLRRGMSPSGEFTQEEVEEYRKKGKIPENWWEIRIAARSHKEYVGYPTQKPLALLERIIRASSNKGDMVLDPFCGCATTCIAAERLEREWIGIDVSIKAYELIQKRLKREIHDGLLEYKKPFYSQKSPKRDKSDIATDPQGFVYVISNSAWEGVYKVGIAKDAKSRLNSYQTSDPNRAYRLDFAYPTPHHRDIERHIHKEFENKLEWVVADIKDIIGEIKKYDAKLRQKA